MAIGKRVAGSTPLRLRRGIELGLVGLIAVLTPAQLRTTARTDEPSPPAVEFVEVEDQICLQPMLHTRHATYADYRDAETRWLKENRPGIPATNWTTELVIPLLPDGRPAGETTIRRDTAHLADVAGPDATVCFDVNLTERTSGKSE